MRIFDLSTSTSELALTLDDVSRQGEAGLLGLALAPDFAASRHVYLYYTAVTGNSTVNRIVRYREVGGRLGERAVLLDGIPAGTIHDGGRLRFGPDGLLYATAGDAANSALAQDQASLAGKFLRLERDGTTPRSNPFGSPIFSWGHRNPQGFDWHPSTREIWATEHGNSGNDEINVIRIGVNYGWPTIEGAQTFPNMEPPVTSFSPSIAPSGAAFYQGTRFPSFVGNLFAATLRGTHLLRLVVDAPARRITRQERLLDGTFGRLRDVSSGRTACIYISTNNRDGRGSPVAADDRIIRLVQRRRTRGRSSWSCRPGVLGPVQGRTWTMADENDQRHVLQADLHRAAPRPRRDRAEVRERSGSCWRVAERRVVQHVEHVPPQLHPVALPTDTLLRSDMCRSQKPGCRRLLRSHVVA